MRLAPSGWWHLTDRWTPWLWAHSHPAPWTAPLACMLCSVRFPVWLIHCPACLFSSFRTSPQVVITKIFNNWAFLSKISYAIFILHLLRWSHCFSPLFYVVTDIYRFSNIKAVFQSWDKHATWSWYILFFCTCEIHFANVLFKIFASCSPNRLTYNFLVPIFLSFSIKVKNAPENIFLSFPPFYISKLVWD